jgi:hypothetical protein
VEQIGAIRPVSNTMRRQLGALANSSAIASAVEIVFLVDNRSFAIQNADGVSSIEISRPAKYSTERSPLPNPRRSYRPMWKSSRPLPDVERPGARHQRRLTREWRQSPGFRVGCRRSLCNEGAATIVLREHHHPSRGDVTYRLCRQRPARSTRTAAPICRFSLWRGCIQRPGHVRLLPSPPPDQFD